MDGRQQPPAAGVRTYRATALAYAGSAVIGVLALVFAGAGLRSGQFVLAAIALVVGALPLLVTWRLRLEVTSRQLRLRTLLDVRTLSLEQVSAAWIEAPRGAWSYWRALPMLVLAVHGTKPLVLNLRSLPDAAVIDLAEQLARRGIGVGVADTPAARSVAARLWPPQRPRR
ncbi:hypothetical protein SAMN05428989_3416 [Pseudoxanthomonas sp. GM95]|uniref:hypothetical protein n=1 Tax=Pseudoxanthomonas sp. GM95 TaxID=1881043 RepID=UPI0008C4B610|nr:hypothetical protein [Pseudoxanthomonas sp. GM95]SEM22357.1 hypothetical protein SAMN05428989_3416 [Pseudoxanthomonas sp. GM95]